MRTLKTIFILFAVAFFILPDPGTVNSKEIQAKTFSGKAEHQNAEIFLGAVKAYESGDYASSAKGFDELISRHGVSSPGLFYNLANSYLKQGNKGMAMLWYERARSFSSGDPDLEYNIAFLERRLEDDFEIKGFILSDEVFFLSKMFSKSSLITITLVLNFFFWVILGCFYFTDRAFLKPLLSLTGISVFIFSLNSFYCYYEKANIKKAVIIPAEVSVRSGTSDKAPELFRLHAGTRVMVEEISGGYARISDGDEKRGWVKADDAVLI